MVDAQAEISFYNATEISVSQGAFMATPTASQLGCVLQVTDMIVSILRTANS